MLEAVIFDMDGVMVESEPVHSRSFEMVLNEYEISPEKDEHGIVHTPGITTKDNWLNLKKKYGLKEDTQVLMDKKRDQMLKLEKDIDPMPGLLDLIKDLQSHNIKLAVGSSSTRQRLELVVERLNLDGAFGTIVSGNDVSEGKPDPEIYLKAADQLSANPKNTIVIEDAIEGVKAGKAAGMKVVAFPSSYSEKHDFSIADTVTGSLSDLNFEVLKKLVS